MGKALGGIAKIGAPIASVIPGGQLVGAGLAGLSSVLDANQAQGQADQIAGQLRENANQNLATSQKYVDPLLRAILGPSGDGATPLGEPEAMFYGDGSRVSTTSGVNPWSSLIRTQAEQAAGEGDRAVAALKNDWAGRGGTGFDTGVGLIRSGQANTISQNRANLNVQGEREAYQRSQDSRDAVLRRIALAVPLVQGLRGGALDTMGGLQGKYASDANMSMGALGNLAQLIAQSGLIGKRGPDAGNNRLGTNQGSSVPPLLNLSQPAVSPAWNPWSIY